MTGPCGRLDLVGQRLACRMLTDDVSMALQSLGRSPQLTQTVLERVQLDPQLPCNVRHIFGPGVYMREIAAAAGTVIIGRRSRLEHGCFVARGALTFFHADGSRTAAKANQEFWLSAGRLLAHVDEDMVFVSIYDTAKRDMEALEALIFSEPSPLLPLGRIPSDGDYEALLAALGPSAASWVAISERTSDLCPFPDGAYKFKVGRSRIEGKGLIATADIAAGEYIAVATQDGKRTPAARYANHAKNPNACFTDRDGSMWLVALKAIPGNRGGFDGEEITVDYRRMPGALEANLS